MRTKKSLYRFAQIFILAQPKLKIWATILVWGSIGPNKKVSTFSTVLSHRVDHSASLSPRRSGNFLSSMDSSSIKFKFCHQFAVLCSMNCMDLWKSFQLCDFLHIIIEKTCLSLSIEHLSMGCWCLLLQLCWGGSFSWLGAWVVVLVRATRRFEELIAQVWWLWKLMLNML